MMADTAETVVVLDVFDRIFTISIIESNTAGS
jgi:hypothetical protein